MRLHPIYSGQYRTVSRKKMLVTPKLAAEWLSTSPYKGRYYDHENACGYAEDMLNGEWEDDYPRWMIALIPGGIVMDGQHRLSAVVMSGCSIRSVVQFLQPKERVA